MQVPSGSLCPSIDLHVRRIVSCCVVAGGKDGEIRSHERHAETPKLLFESDGI